MDNGQQKEGKTLTLTLTMKPKADSWELRGLGLEVRVEGDYMDDSQLVRTVRMLLRSYRTKYYALEERNIMRSVRGLRGGKSLGWRV